MTEIYNQPTLMLIVLEYNTNFTGTHMYVDNITYIKRKLKIGMHNQNSLHTYCSCFIQRRML